VKPIIDVGTLHLVLALFLVLIVLAISYRERLGLERELVIATGRTFLQLFAVGYFLVVLFAWDRWELVLVTLFLMLGAATGSRWSLSRLDPQSPSPSSPRW
jgi:putative ABC transport system permease protein